VKISENRTEIIRNFSKKIVKTVLGSDKSCYNSADDKNYDEVL